MCHSCPILLPICSKCIWPNTITFCLLLPKELRGRTVLKQNHEVGEACIHSLGFSSDSFTLDLTTSLSPDFLSVTQCSAFVPCFPEGLGCLLVPSGLYDFIIALPELFSGSPSGAGQSRSPYLTSWVLCPTLLLYCKQTVPWLLLFTHHRSFCLSQPSLLISSLQGRLNWTPSTYFTWPSLVPHCTLYNTHMVLNTLLLCITIFMYEFCLHALCWMLYNCNHI